MSETRSVFHVGDHAFKYYRGPYSSYYRCFIEETKFIVRFDHDRRVWEGLCCNNGDFLNSPLGQEFTNKEKLVVFRKIIDTYGATYGAPLPIAERSDTFTGMVNYCWYQDGKLVFEGYKSNVGAGAINRTFIGELKGYTIRISSVRYGWRAYIGDKSIGSQRTTPAALCKWLCEVWDGKI